MSGDLPRPERGPAFSATVAEDGDTVIVTLAGELDLAWAADVRRAFDAACGSTLPAVRVDLGPLRFVDSTGLRELVILHQALAQAGRSLTFTPGGPAVQRVLEVSGLLDVLRVEPSSGV